MEIKNNKMKIIKSKKYKKISWNMEQKRPKNEKHLRKISGEVEPTKRTYICPTGDPGIEN